MAKMNTNLDDWETDPDFVRDMDEMDQRWGNKRTVGSINMNELIDEVSREHKSIREKNHHSSQRDYSSGLFDRDDHQQQQRPPVSSNFESQKKISRKVITESSESSYIRDSISNRDLIKKTTVESSTATQKTNPIISPKPDFSDLASRLSSGGGGGGAGRSTITERFERLGDPIRSTTYDNVKTEPPKQFKETSSTKRIFEEEKKSSSTSSSRDNISSSRSPSASAAFKSIQDKIDAFKKEFEDIENKVAKKSDISRVIKKSTNVEKFDNNVKYVTRSTDKLEQQSSNPVQQRATTTNPNGNIRSTSSASNVRPSSTSPLYGTKKESPKTSIKSLSEKFESLGRETSEDFRRRMEERRREFFDEVKTQVRETRKGLDGFDIIDSDDEDARAGSGRRQQQQQQSRGQADDSVRSSTMSPVKPKVYTKHETTQEQIVSKFVKENDRVIHDETKRNVERTSSCHGSSDDDEEPTSIKYINRELKRTSPQATSSPIDELKRKMPFVEPTNQSSGLMARTLYDYQAAEDDELSFDVDVLITNIEKLDKGWYKGTITRNDQKQVGLFPANHVKLLNDSSFY